MICPMDTTGDIESNFDSELDCFLRTCGHDDRWRVIEVLKDADATGSTEVVVPAGASVAHGSFDSAVPRYVRKVYPVQSDGADVYEALQRAQQVGLFIDHVPKIVECLRGPERRSVVMEYVEGLTLSEYVSSGSVSPAVMKYLFLQLCMAVRELHECINPPVIHRDLKPSNIIISPSGPQLIDFGIARLWHEDAECDTTHFGTRRYAPPEQFGFGQTSVRSDIYALGKVLFFCLTGKQPPNAMDASSCEKAGIPRSIARVICKACAFDPRERYTSVRELGAAVSLLPQQVWTGCSHLISISPSTTFNSIENRVNQAGQALAKVQGGVGFFQRLLRRIPRWAGVIWNLLLICELALCVMGSQFAIFYPNAFDSTLPFWFRVMEYDLLLLSSLLLSSAFCSISVECGSAFLCFEIAVSFRSVWLERA